MASRVAELEAALKQREADLEEQQALATKQQAATAAEMSAQEAAAARLFLHFTAPDWFARLLGCFGVN